MSIKLNGNLIVPTIFSDKTSQVWKVENVDNFSNSITWDFENESEFMHLAQLVQLIRQVNSVSYISLHVPYLPYARQDKEVSNESTFALKTFASLLNNLGIDRVTAEDVHSNIANELIVNFESISPLANIQAALLDLGYPEKEIHIVYPDKGASDRYTSLLDNFNDSIVGHKVRDQLTGYITEYNIEGNPEGKDILIVDDICDGGMTFKLMTKELYDQGANSVNLYVSHGIFSKGIETLRESGIKRIFTKDGEVLFDNEVKPKPPEGLLETELSNI